MTYGDYDPFETWDLNGEWTSHGSCDGRPESDVLRRNPELRALYRFTRFATADASCGGDTNCEASISIKQKLISELMSVHKVRGEPEGSKRQTVSLLPQHASFTHSFLLPLTPSSDILQCRRLRTPTRPSPRRLYR